MKADKTLITLYGLLAFFSLVFILSVAFLYKSDPVEKLIPHSSSREFIEYISSGEKTEKLLGSTFIKLFDVKGGEFLKICTSEKNSYGVLMKSDDGYRIYTIDSRGAVLYSFAAERSSAKINDIKYKDGLYLLAGEKEGFAYIGAYGAADGQLRWSNFLNLKGEFKTLRPVSQGYLAGGYLLNAQSKQALTTELNLNGDTVWTDTYTRGDNEYISSIVPLADGFFAIGSSNSNPLKDFNVLILRYDIHGIKRFDGALIIEHHDETPLSAVSDKEENLFICGLRTDASSYAQKSLILKLPFPKDDTDRLKETFLDIKAIDKQSSLNSIIFHNNRAYCVGSISADDGKLCGFLKIINSDGSLYYERVYDINEKSWFSDIIPTQENTLLIVGAVVKNGVKTPAVFSTDLKGGISETPE